MKPCNIQQWLIGLIVFGGKDPVSSCIVCESAFDEAFLKEKCLSAWENVGAAPFTQKCFKSKQVRHEFWDSDNKVNAMIKSMKESNDLNCYF